MALSLVFILGIAAVIIAATLVIVVLFRSNGD